MRLLTHLLVLTLATLAWLPTASAESIQPPEVEVEEDEVYFTRHNLWYEKGIHLTTNYSAGDMLPINSKVTLVKLSRDYLTIQTESGERIVLQNIAKHSKRSTRQVATRLLSPTRIPIESLGDQRAKEIRTGRLRLGMSKDEVVMTRGYPPGHKTPSLEYDEWVYWSTRFVKRTLVFDNDVLKIGRGLI